MNVVAIVSSLIVIVGCFMPWLQLGALFANRGIDNPDGAIILIASIISGALAIYNHINNKTKLKGIYIAVGLLGLIIAYVDLNDVQDRAKQAAHSFGELNDAFGSDREVSVSDFIGSGLYVVGLGSIGLLLTGLGVFGSRPAKKNIELKSTVWRNVPPSAYLSSNPVETYSDEESEAYHKKIFRVNELISIQQRRFPLDDETTELQSLLRSMAKTKPEGIHLINVYKQVFKKDLIEELKKMNGVIYKNLSLFVDLRIIDSRFPHDGIPI
jgi:multisubunit Na+/H+ antiporter MnhB subunit